MSNQSFTSPEGSPRAALNTDRREGRALVYRRSRAESDATRTGGREVKGGWVGQDRVTPSMETGPFCGLKDECGSCAFVNLDYEKSLQKKFSKERAFFDEDVLFKTARFTTPVPSPRLWGYRCHVKLAVRPKTFSLGSERFAIGLFAPESHQVVEVDDCPLHLESLRAFVKDMRALLEASLLEPYDEESDSGDIRYLVARSAHLTGELLVTVVCRTQKKAQVRQLIQDLVLKGHRIVAAFMNVNESRSNVIFEGPFLRLTSHDKLRERVLGFDFELSPRTFFQVNPWQAEQLYRRIEDIVGPSPKGATAWDLYSGAGQIAMVLARLGYRVLGLEEVPDAVDDAYAHGKRNFTEGEPEYCATRIEDAASKIPLWAKYPDVILLNPSRRGMAAEARESLIKVLLQKPQSKLVYVSCEGETLRRDLRHILSASGRKIRQVEAFDMFPHTDKLEWITVIS